MIWIHDRLKPKVWTSQRTKYKQVKCNGHRLTFFKPRNGKTYAFGRDVRPHLEFTFKHPWVLNTEWWKALQQIPPHSSVDGEIHIPYGNAADTTTAIAKGDDRLIFTPFAVPWWNGSQYLGEELDCMQLQLSRWTDLRFSSYFPLLAIDTRTALLHDAKSMGIEGWVLKNYNYAEWWKVKPEKDVDVIVTGFKDGEGKYLGWVGALRISAWIDNEYKEIACVSGMTDAVRYAIDEKDDIGRVCEIKYTDIGNKGRLVHPRFIRWRDDKPADECRYEKEQL